MFTLVAAILSGAVSLIIYRWTNIGNMVVCKDTHTETVVGEPAREGHSVTIEIAYSGKKPISQRQYEEPLAFTFGASARVHSYRVYCHTALGKRLVKNAVCSESRITLPKMLINNKEKITVVAVVTGFERVSVHGRIENVEIHHRKD